MAFVSDASSNAIKRLGHEKLMLSIIDWISQNNVIYDELLDRNKQVGLLNLTF